MITSLSDAVSELVHDGDVVAMEGFTHLIPFAAAHEVIRQRKHGLTLVRMTPDLIYDQMIGMGCAAKVIFSWCGNPGVGPLHRIVDALENGWPAPLEFVEHSHAGMACAYEAGAAGLPFAVLWGYKGTDLAQAHPHVTNITCPFTGQELSAVAALRPDVAIVHAQQADREGNVLLWGQVGVQKEVVLASKRAIVTVEEVVRHFDDPARGTLLPAWVVDAVCPAPGGVWPSFAQGYGDRDNAFYWEWDRISRTRSSFLSWMEQEVLGATPGGGGERAHATG